jgi:hypothetical protein
MKRIIGKSKNEEGKNIVEEIKKWINKNIILIKIETKEEIEVLLEEIKMEDILGEENVDIDELYTYRENTILNPIEEKDNKGKIRIFYGDNKVEEDTFRWIPIRLCERKVRKKLRYAAIRYYKIDIENRKLISIRREECYGEEIYEHKDIYGKNTDVDFWWMNI